jgi:hypothetical protein
VFYPEDDRFLNRRDENISLTRSSDPTGRRELGIDRTNLYREIVPCEAPSHARRLVPIGRIGILLTTAIMGCFFCRGSLQGAPAIR